MAKIIHAADMFCGAGGTTTGLKFAAEAMGLNLKLVAVNHWNRAIETHAHNHPWADHLCTGLDALKPSAVVPGKKLDLLIASPECTHHSIARGGKPCDDQSRSSAFHILHWCQELYVRNLLIENVPEFTGWGPLGVNGKPLKSMKGQTFQAFLTSLQSLGYSIDWKIVNCADHGDATTRQRFFLLARRGQKKVLWPEQTHGQNEAVDMFGKSLKPWKPAKDIIDWNIPGHSIFLDPEDVKKAGIKIKRPLAKNTLKRIEAGIRKYWGEWAQPFLVILYGTNDARSVDRPFPTVTANGTHIGLCRPFFVRYNGKGADRRAQSIDNPISTLDTSNRFGVCKPFITIYKGQSLVRGVDESLPTLTTSPHLYVCEPFIIPQHSGGAPRAVSDPLSTICTESRGISLIQPFVVPAAHAGGDRARSTEQPLSTLVAKPDHYLVDPFIVKYYGTAKAVSVEEPLDSVTTNDRFGLVRLKVVRIGDEKYLLDILFRMLTPKELSAAHSFPEDYYFAGTKSDVVRQIGNSVPVKTATNLCESLLAA